MVFCHPQNFFNIDLNLGQMDANYVVTIAYSKSKFDMYPLKQAILTEAE